MDVFLFIYDSSNQRRCVCIIHKHWKGFCWDSIIPKSHYVLFYSFSLHPFSHLIGLIVSRLVYCIYFQKCCLEVGFFFFFLYITLHFFSILLLKLYSLILFLLPSTTPMLVLKDCRYTLIHVFGNVLKSVICSSWFHWVFLSGHHLMMS